MNDFMLGIVQPVLAAHERDLLFLLIQGRTTAQAAHTLGLSLDAVERTLVHLQARCGVAARSGLIARAVIQGWVTSQS